jgi:hypothetical protein
MFMAVVAFGDRLAGAMNIRSLAGLQEHVR